MRENKITEKIGSHSNEDFPQWYEEKIKTTAEFIMKKIKPGDSPTQDTISKERKDMVVK